jgi:DNA polymerase elongation subunit (family B)
MKLHPDDKVLNSKYWAVKVLMNSIYGYEGQASSRWGELPVAMATVGLCRWIVEQVESMMIEHLIEVDTDGIYIDFDPDIDTVNKRMSGIIEKTFGVQSRMDIELEEFDDGYFYRTKNYILRHNGKLHVKGNAFKSSKHSRVYEKATQVACEFILDTGATIGNQDLWFKRNDLVRKLTDWDSYELTDFIKHVTLDKDPDMYVNQNVMQVKLAEQAKKYLSQELHSGDGVDYIVTTRGRDNKEYTIAPRVTDRRQVYLDYYEGELETLLTALGFSETTRTGQLELPI